MGELKLKPYINIGPGDVLKRNIGSLGWSQEDLAQIVDMSVKTISKIINNQQRLTVQTAKLLSKALETSPEYWLNLDSNYRLRMIDDNSNESAAEIKAEIRRYMPVLEIQKKGWSPVDSSVNGYQRTFLDIWNLKNVDIGVYEKKSRYCARRNKDDENYTKYYSLTWLQVAKNFAKEIKVPKFSSDALKQLCFDITKYTQSDEGIVAILKDLKKIGIKFFVQSHLSKTYLDGACFLDSDNPVIVYTARHDRIDNFWYALVHEIAHVLLHLSSDVDGCFLDDLDKKDVNGLELEADEMAEKILKVEEVIKLSAPFRNYFSSHNLQEISNELKLEPSLVLGILQYRGYVDYRKLNKYKRKVSELLPRDAFRG